MIPSSVCPPWQPEQAANAAQDSRSYTTSWGTIGVWRGSQGHGAASQDAQVGVRTSCLRRVAGGALLMSYTPGYMGNLSPWADDQGFDLVHKATRTTAC